MSYYLRKIAGKEMEIDKLLKREIKQESEENELGIKPLKEISRLLEPELARDWPD